MNSLDNKSIDTVRDILGWKYATDYEKLKYIKMYLGDWVDDTAVNNITNAMKED